MIPSDTPWSGLEVGKTDTRRVSASARWNWFWAVMPRLDAALVLRMNELPDPVPTLPKLKNLEIRFQTLMEGPIFYVRLKDHAQLELFQTLCRDVIAAGEIAQTESEALARAIARTFRWHYLLRGGKLETLSENDQKGLIGEIEILKLLITTLGAKSALAAWTGPKGAPKDFEMRADCIEVKARRGASKPFLKISNEHQLSEVTGRRLWLSVLAVDKAQPPHGKTLTDYHHEVTGLLEQAAPALIDEWGLRIADAGLDPFDDYSPWRWIASPADFYLVDDDFPRLATPVPIGVTGVSYSLALSACAPFKTAWTNVRSKLIEEV